MLKFHKYEDGSRTPLEEHLVEGALYAANKSGKVNVHFTVSPEHRALFKALVDEKAAAYARKYGVDYNISFSEQKPSTDTVAADMENKPFRDNGKLLFRPGGHGALIENLNDLDADVIFIKNIDNVVPDKLKGDTVLYKKLIAGVLITLQQQALLSATAGQRQVHARAGSRHPAVCTEEAVLQEPRNEESGRCRTGDLPEREAEPSDACLRHGEERRRAGWRSVPCLQQRRYDSLQILESSQIDMNDPEKEGYVLKKVRTSIR